MLIIDNIQVLGKLFCSFLYIPETVRYYNQTPHRFWTVYLLILKMDTAMKVRGGFRQKKKKLRQVNLLNSSSQHGCNDSYKLNHFFPVTNIFFLDLLCVPVHWIYSWIAATFKIIGLDWGIFYNIKKISFSPWMCTSRCNIKKYHIISFCWQLLGWWMT